jgi:glycosyltransferase involved in cell wall biosynthesis
MNPSAKLSIAILSKADRFGGGASRHAETLAQGLIDAGHRVDHWVGAAKSEHVPWRRFLTGGRFTRSSKWLRQMSCRMGYPDLLPVELSVLLRNGRWKEYDLFHFHDLSSAISIYTVAWLARRKPLFWTMHDCGGFTAGCLYPGACDRFQCRCGPCPQLGQWPLDTSRDKTAGLHRIKRRLWAEKRIVPIVPSQWMKVMLERSAVDSLPAVVIPNGIIPPRAMGQKSRAELRSARGIVAGRVLALFTAHGLADSRKGLALAAKAISRLPEAKRPLLVLCGRGLDQCQDILEGLPYIGLGTSGDSRQLNEWYSLADYHLYCGLEDNLPLTVLETMALGIPTVGFATGGVPEMVQDGQTGRLVPVGDMEALSRAIDECQNQDLMTKWGRVALERFTRHFTLERMIENHLNLYRHAVENPGKMDVLNRFSYTDHLG